MKSFSRDKKKEERNILDYFSLVYSDFPKGRIAGTESPDFIIHLNHRQKLGIELTRLTQTKMNNEKYFPAQISHLENTIIAQAQKIHDESSPAMPLYLSVSFKNDIEVKAEETGIIAKEIVDDIQKNIFTANRKSVFHFSVHNPGASEYVNLIEGVHFPGIKDSLWINAGGFEIPTLTREYLTTKIKSKEQKLPLYRRKKLSFFWLILVTDSMKRSISFNIHNQIQAWNIDSEFDRVFLFELLENKVYLLK